MRGFLLPLCLSVVLAQPAVGQEPVPVGFRFLWMMDDTRTWAGTSGSTPGSGDESGRPLRISVWYPAAAEGEAMPFAGYVHATPPDSAFEPLADVVEAYDRSSYRGLFEGDSTGLDRFLRSVTGAIREAEPAAGPFPLVLYSAGWGNRSSDNTLLAESIARHGYVVVTVPQIAARRPRVVSRSTVENLEAQVRDLETAMARVFELPFVDRGRVAAIGYSTGGRIALALAARNAHVDAAVGLDPSYVLSEDAGRIAEEGMPDPERLRVPVLTIHRAAPEAVDPSVLDSARFSDRWTFAIEGAGHGDFSDDAPVQERYGLEGDGDAAVHAAVVDAVVRFLDRTISSGDGDPSEVLDELEAGRVSATTRPRVPAPDAAGWEALVRAEGLGGARTRLEDLESGFPDTDVAEEAALNDRAYYLVDRGEPGLAADLLRLAAAAHPASVNLQDSLGETCLTAGDRDCAGAAYRRVLELLPRSDLPEWLADYYRESATRGLERLDGRDGPR